MGGERVESVENVGCVEDCRVASFGFFDEEAKEFRSNQNVQIDSDLYSLLSVLIR